MTIDGAPSQEEEDLLWVAKMWELDLDRVATMGGREVKLQGFKTRSRKWNVQIKEVDSDRIRLITESTARRLFSEGASA